jgi:hypothetical protein
MRYETVKMVKLSNGREVQVRSLTFKDFIRFSELISQVLNDILKGHINPSVYLQSAVPFMSAMTSLSQREIEELKPSDALKIFNACIDVLREDADFFTELKVMLQKVNEFLSQKS